MIKRPHGFEPPLRANAGHVPLHALEDRLVAVLGHDFGAPSSLRMTRLPGKSGAKPVKPKIC
eukprot:12429649-Alexandrium_andersonii.AAC.1